MKSPLTAGICRKRYRRHKRCATVDAEQVVASPDRVTDTDSRAPQRRSAQPASDTDLW
jgi:hypothetical protein